MGGRLVGFPYCILYAQRGACFSIVVGEKYAVVDGRTHKYALHYEVGEIKQCADESAHKDININSRHHSHYQDGRNGKRAESNGNYQEYRKYGD